MNEKINYFQILKNNWRLILTVAGVIAFLGLVVTAVQPFKYRSTIQLSVLENQPDWDGYSAIRSAEKINNNLSHLVYTTSFLNKILLYGFIEADTFPADQVKKKKAWAKTISTYVVPETSILKIDVYHRQREQATKLAEGIAYVMTVNSQEYIGSEKVTIQIVDQPITSKYPVKPNIALNLIASLSLGILFSLGYLLLTYDPLKEEAKERGRAERLVSRKIKQEDNIRIAVQPVIENVKSNQPIEEKDIDNNFVQIPIMNQEAELEPSPVRIEDGKPGGAESLPVGKAGGLAGENKQAFYEMLFPEKNQNS